MFLPRYAEIILKQQIPNWILSPKLLILPILPIFISDLSQDPTMPQARRNLNYLQLQSLTEFLESVHVLSSLLITALFLTWKCHCFLRALPASILFSLWPILCTGRLIISRYFSKSEIWSSSPNTLSKEVFHGLTLAMK